MKLALVGEVVCNREIDNGNEAAEVPDRVKRVYGRLKERMMVLNVASLQVNWQMAEGGTVLYGIVWTTRGARLVLERRRQGFLCGPHHRRQMLCRFRLSHCLPMKQLTLMP